MTRAPWNAAIGLLAFAAGACVQVGQIQETKPVRTLKFTGSHKLVAQCIQQRLGGKVQDEAFGERYVIYDAVKGKQTEGPDALRDHGRQDRARSGIRRMADHAARKGTRAGQRTTAGAAIVGRGGAGILDSGPRLRRAG